MFDQFVQVLANNESLPAMVAILLVLMVSIGFAAISGGGGGTRRRLRQLQALRREGAPTGRFHAAKMHHVKDTDLDELEDGAVVPGPLGAISALISSLPLLGQKDRDKIRSLLNRAGIRGEDAMGLYVAAKLFAFAAGILAVLILTATLNYPDSKLIRLGMVLAGAIGGGMIPEMFLNNLVARRAKKIESALPDALDLMVICTESGLSLDPTIDRVAREMRLSSPELARELAIVSHEMRILPRRDTALMNFAERNSFKSVRSLVTTLVQTMKYGTSLAHSLRVLANESRNQRMLKVEEKAAQLPAKMSLPLVCCMLPAVFLIIGGPAISQVFKIF